MVEKQCVEQEREPAVLALILGVLLMLQCVQSMDIVSVQLINLVEQSVALVLDLVEGEEEVGAEEELVEKDQVLAVLGQMKGALQSPQYVLSMDTVSVQHISQEVQDVKAVLI